MTRQVIRSAMQSRLASLTPPWPIAWENVKHTPTIGTAWMQASVLFGETTTAGISLNAGERWNGYMQVNVYAPASKGPKIAEDRADLIRGKSALFFHGLVIEQSGKRIVCTQPYDMNPMQDAEWWALPIRVPFYCYSF